MKSYSEDLRKGVVDAIEQATHEKRSSKCLGCHKPHQAVSSIASREGSYQSQNDPWAFSQEVSSFASWVVEQQCAYLDVNLQRRYELWEQTHGVQGLLMNDEQSYQTRRMEAKKSRWQPVNVTRKSEATGASK